MASEQERAGTLKTPAEAPVLTPPSSQQSGHAWSRRDRPERQDSASPDDPGRSDPRAKQGRWGDTAFAVGTGAAALVVAIITLVYAMISGMRTDVSAVVSEMRGYFVDHVADHEVVSPDEMDAEAASILDGASPESWTLMGNVVSIDDSFAVSAPALVEQAFPNRDRGGPIVECSVHEGGVLTVRGFSEERNAALIEYSTDAPTGGTPCESGIYFFFRPADEERGAELAVNFFGVDG